jgi:endonuclease/exonuclease/phosphatase family metal-dependent hydrolase
MFENSFSMRGFMFSVLTFNLRFGLAEDGPNNWIHRKQSFPPFFEKYRPDFIGFQEANDFQGDFLKRILNEYKVIGERSPAPRFWQNNLIFYQADWRCMNHKHFFLSATPDIPSRSPKSRWPRQCTMGMFEKEDRRVIFITTHFDFDASVQTQSAEIIMAQLSKFSADVPAVLTGDFNAEPSRPCYQAFIGEAPKPTHFKNVFGEPFPATFHGFKGNTEGDHIDWILYRGKMIPEKSRVIRDKFEGFYPSDHFPVFAEFRFLDA